MIIYFYRGSNENLIVEIIKVIFGIFKKKKGERGGVERRNRY